MTKEIDRICFRVRGMYFSGTGTTERIVSRIAQRLVDTAKADLSDIRPISPETAEAYRPAGKQAATGRHTAAFTKEPDIDLTPPPAREQIYRFGPEDIIVFGVPVIAGRVPNVLLPFLHTLEGDGAMAVPVVLYGNRNFDDALIELRDILEEQGFYTVAAAAFIGEHSFSRVLAAGRPDAQDMGIADAFADTVAEKIRCLWNNAWQDAGRFSVQKANAAADSERIMSKGDVVKCEGREEPSSSGNAKFVVTAPDNEKAFATETADIEPELAMAALGWILEDAGPIEVEGQQPYRPYYKPRDRQGNHINILKVKPKLDPAKCTQCGICVDACPMGSIPAEKPGVVEGICIKCCGCEKKCPEGALYFDDPGYLYHKEELELGYPQRREPKVFL